jgi:hypothetical protein
MGFVKTEKGSKTNLTDIRRRIPLKGVLGPKFLSAFKTVVKSRHDEFVRESEVTLALDLSIEEEFRLHLFCYIINNGKNGITKIRSVFPNCSEIDHIGKVVVDLKINPDNIKEWRAVITMLEFENPIEGILNNSMGANTKEGDSAVSELQEKLNSFYFTEEETRITNKKINVCGAVFKPGKKKDFKRDYVSNGQIKNRLSFSIMENSDESIEVAVFDSDSYQPVRWNNEDVKYEDLIKDYNMLKIRINAQFNDDLSDYKFAVDRGLDTITPIKFKASSKNKTTSI